MEEQNKEKKVTRYRLERHKWPDEIQAEKDHRLKIAIVVCICIACFLSGFMMNNVMNQSGVASSDEYDKWKQIYEVMANNWYFGKDVEDLRNTLLTNSIDGMTANDLDPHTMYMEPEVFENFTSSLQGNFVGIGIQYYAQDTDTFVVDRVFKGSGAEAGGMLKGDIIYKVDGVDVSSKSLDEISSMIKGEEGTKVKITVIRENAEKELTITRAVVNDSVYGYDENGVGILEINSFAETSGDEVGKYLAEFKQKNIKKLIIDLRGNGGGYVNAALQIASYLIDKGGVVLQEKNKAGEVKQQYSFDDYPRYKFDKIVVLINDETASASEVLTSCLKEQVKNVVTVGVNSYGKGTVQMPITFEDGSSFKYTIAEWLTPKGEHINNKGIKPDYEVALDPAIETGVPAMEEGVTFEADTVSIYAKPVQIYLKFLDYPVDRQDEYFSVKSSDALRSYQKEHNLNANGQINEESIQSLLSSCSLKWHDEQDKLDTQMNKAMELMK